MNLVRQDDRLFEGLFYIAIKDVLTSDVDDLKQEFHDKIQCICRRNQESFFTKMYASMIEIAAMPPLQRTEYHDSVCGIASVIMYDLEASFRSGRELATDLKLVLAQISTKDWSSFESKRLALRIEMLERNLETAVCMGRLSKYAKNDLVNFDTHKAMSDDALEFDQLVFDIADAGLELYILTRDFKRLGET